MQPHQRRGILISALGLVLMLAAGMGVADFRRRIAPARFLVQPMNLAVTPDESRIVVGSGFAKLHVLDARGRTLREWPLPTQGGPFRIEIAGDDRVRVATARTGLLLEYGLDGDLASERRDADAFARMGAANEHDFTAASGGRYRIEGGRVLRGEQVLVDGFASHAAMTLRMLAMGGGLLLGVALVIGGFVSTGRRRARD